MPYSEGMVRVCCVPGCGALGVWGKAGRCPDHRQRYSRTDWQTVRREALKRARWRCSACGSRNDLVVHHLGPTSRPTSVRVLCRRCHEKLHLGHDV